MAKVVNAELIQTWPEALTQLLDKSRALLQSYEKERQRLDAIRKGNDLVARANIPLNKYRVGKEDLAVQADEILACCRLQGFHGTRLAEDEARALKARGLVPVSSDFLKERIENRIASGDIPEEIGRALINSNKASDDSRRDMIWLSFTQQSLKDEAGFYRLFRHWGGESLYWGYEYDQEISSILRSIGTPTIVSCSIDPKEIECFSSLGHRFIAIWQHLNAIPCADDMEFEGYVKSPIHPASILDVVRYGSPEFEELTQAGTWKKCIK